MLMCSKAMVPLQSTYLLNECPVLLLVSVAHSVQAVIR